MRCAKTATIVIIFSVAVAVRAQNAAPTPLHPIDTKPEGVQPGCSASATYSSGGNTSGSSTCSPATTAAPAPASAAEKFKYPGDTPAQQSPIPQSPVAPNTTQRFPFPGDDAKPATTDAPQPSTAQDGASKDSGFHDAGSSGSSSKPDADSSSSSSSSNSSSSSSSSGEPAPGDTSPLGDAAPAPKHGRKKLPPVARQTPDERESEDIQVAQFYQNDKNYKAAYLRATDAVTLGPTDPDAHFALAEAARRLGKFDEAELHYKKCLTLDPLPKEKKEAQNALKEMAGG